MLGFTTLSQTPLSQVTTLAEATITLSGSLGTFAQGTITITGVANHTLPAGAVGTLDAGTASFAAAANTTPTGVSATSTANDDFTLTGTANFTPPAVTATFAQAIEFAAEASFTIGDTLADITAGTTAFNAKANITPTGNSSSSTVNAVTATVASRALISGAFAVAKNNLAKPLAVRFPYENFADQYDRTRTIYLLARDKNLVVHVSSIDYTVYVTAINDNNTVHVTAEDRTVHIGAVSQDNTVYIRR